MTPDDELRERTADDRPDDRRVGDGPSAAARPLRVAAGFVGCKVSQADGEEALAALAAAGLEPVTSREHADVVVVHTCCVTAEAERKSRRLVRRAASSGRRVVASGCAAVLRPEQFEGAGVTVEARPSWDRLAADLAAEVRHAETGAGPDDVVAGGSASSDATSDATSDADPGRTHLPRAAAGKAGTALGKAGTAAGKAGTAAGSDGTHGAGGTGEAPRATPGARTRLVLKVQDGCSGACAYCVVRLVRGRPRSMSLEAALSAARAGVEQGCGEVVLSGIDLGAWRDAAAAPGSEGGAARLPDLVGAVAELDGLRRVRLSSIEPRHVTPALLRWLGHARVARHLHVPLQSADDGVLRAMKRPYTFEEYLRAVGGLRDVPGGTMLSTDVIVGYPTEDEAAFARTLEALESGLFGRVHVFAYSPRPGTAAAELPPLPTQVVKERMRRALAAAGSAALSARRIALGREAEVLVEERRDGLWRGYSSEYIRYALRGQAQRGELITAVADELAGDGVTGRIVAAGAARGKERT